MSGSISPDLTKEMAQNLEKVSVELLLDLHSGLRKVISIAPSASIIEAAQHLKTNNIGLLIVSEKEKMVGVLSERDVVQRWVCGPKFPNAVQVKDVMSPDVETITPFDTIYDCYLRLVARRCRHLPIVDPLGSVMGILSLRDVTSYVINQLRVQNLN
jgi:CBS domain-containing protein